MMSYWAGNHRICPIRLLNPFPAQVSHSVSIETVFAEIHCLGLVPAVLRHFRPPFPVQYSRTLLRLLARRPVRWKKTPPIDWIVTPLVPEKELSVMPKGLGKRFSKRNATLILRPRVRHCRNLAKRERRIVHGKRWPEGGKRSDLSIAGLRN